MMNLQPIEIKFNKSYLIGYLIISLSVVGGSMYILCYTNTFPELYTKIGGTIASLIILFGVSGKFISRLILNPTEILITPEKISFQEENQKCEILISSVASFNFTRFYDRYRIRRQLIVLLNNGEEKIMELNGLNIRKADLERMLNALIA
jgi:hypothetical protein